LRRAVVVVKTLPVQTRFLLGPAGSGKTFRCLAEIRRELIAQPDGAPLLLLAPKQATFQLERQLLADPQLGGYTRLHILSFERLANFVLNNLGIATKKTLGEEGRVMVLRALLMREHKNLKVFRASARLTGFAQQLSLLLREFQRHRLAPVRLKELSLTVDVSVSLRDKLHDLALLLGAYADWLKANDLQDVENILDEAARALNHEGKLRPADVWVQEMWLDGFAEMTPQEMELLAALVPHCGRATLAFCLESEPQTQPSWLSTWSVVAQTFRRCHSRLAGLDGNAISVETLASHAGQGRFAASEPLRLLEMNWSRGDVVTPQTTSAAIRLVTCADAESEVVFAAREILRHVRSGGRYRDCAIILRSLATHQAALARTLRRYDIPFFMDDRESATHHPLAELTRFALRTLAFNWRHDDWFGALKTGLVPAAERDLDWLENLALARGWEGGVWQKAISIADNESLAARVETLRDKIVSPFLILSKHVAAPLNGRELVLALREFWSALDVENTIAGWGENSVAGPGDRQAQVHQTVLKQMASWLENVERAFPDEVLSLRDWLPITEAGLAGLSVGVIPPSLDQVLVGAIDRSRNPEIKLACVLGLNEGVFPAPPATGKLLTDIDRTNLEREDIYLGPTNRQQIGHERYFGYIAITRASERLVLTRSARDAKNQPLNPSQFFDHVRRISGVSEETFVVPGLSDVEHVSEIAPMILRSPVRTAFHRTAALQPLIERQTRVQAAEHSELSSQVVEMIFRRELKSSVSRLEDFAACPFKFFAASTLRLQERKEFEFDDRDKGSFHHSVLEEFHKRVIASDGAWRKLNPTVAVNLVGDIAREMLPRYENGKFLRDGESRFTGALLIERLQQLIHALISWMPQYDFDPVACEIAFKDGGALPAWRFHLGDGRVLKLGGRIDRVDLLRRSDGTALAVIVDYKSRVKRLDESKLHHGLELQLLSYLGVLNQLTGAGEIFGAKSLKPAGVFYVPLNGGAAKTKSDRREIVENRNRTNPANYQHSGRFLADELQHFDNRNVPKGDQFKYKKNKDGNFARSGNEALPAYAFDELRGTVETQLRDYAARIFSGEASVSPFRLGKQTACDYCDFRSVCRFDPWTQPYRVLQKPGKDE
jgi:ATP-dependent helicase/nuclease subunit B